VFDIFTGIGPGLLLTHLSVFLCEGTETEAGPEHGGGKNHIIVDGTDLLLLMRKQGALLV